VCLGPEPVEDSLQTDQAVPPARVQVPSEGVPHYKAEVGDIQDKHAFNYLPV